MYCIRLNTTHYFYWKMEMFLQLDQMSSGQIGESNDMHKRDTIEQIIQNYQILNISNVVAYYKLCIR